MTDTPAPMPPTAPAPSLVKRALGAHCAIGLVAGALLYLVCLTGTLAVFHEEIALLEQTAAPRLETIDPQALQRGIAAVLATQTGPERTSHLIARLPDPRRPLATIATDKQALHLNGDGAIWGAEDKSWSAFLVALHYSLNLPGIVGLAVVGALGAMMLALSLSGVIALPRIFRDAFFLRARGGNGVALAQWHNRLGTWTLPFGLAIGLTGAVLGTASIVYQAIASQAYGGNIEAVYAPIYGAEGAPDSTPAPLPDIAAMLGTLRASHPHVRPTYAVIHEPLTAGQHVQLVGMPPRKLIFGEYYVFDGDGTFHGPVGLADGDMGQQAIASAYSLHFGNFAGLWVQLAYFLFGLALTLVCATGPFIWLGKRERRGQKTPGLRRLWHGIVWGAPAMLALTLMLKMSGCAMLPFAQIFWLGLLAILCTLARLQYWHGARRPN